MDNFRRYRSRPNKTSSTDGFIRASGVRKIRQSPALRRGNAYESRSTRVGNFRTTDGFYPVDISSRKIGRISEDNTTNWRPIRNASSENKLDDHINIDEIKESKSLRRFGRRKRREKGSSSWIKRFGKFLLFNPFRKKNWTKGRVLSHATIILFILAGLFGARAWWLANQIFRGGGGAVAMQEDIDPSMLRGEGDGRINILLLGRGGEGHDGPDLTDTIIIASINPIQKEAAMLSIPRDLYIQVNGSYTKINAVFANAKYSALANYSNSDNNRTERAEEVGLKAVEDVIESKIGIPIHYHGLIDFAGFTKAIETVGGVDVNVPKSATVYEPGMWLMGQSYNLKVSEGQNHFDGIRALAYSRSRETSPGGDFDRSERQRLLLVALKDKIFSAGTYGNPIKINQLMSDFGNHIRINMSLNEVKRLYDISSEIPSDRITSVGLNDPPNNYVTTGTIHGQSVVYPRAGLDNYKEIQFFVRNKLKDGFLAHENATVAIYNSTFIEGLAGRTSDELKSFGYNISVVDDAPNKGLQKTVVVDLSGGKMKYTKRYLENRFGTTAVSQMPPNTNIEPGNANFVIILGQNEQTRLAN